MADDRPCIEMGSRRTHEEAAVAAARAAYIAGFAATSNLEAGRTLRRARPAGTAAHSFTLLHDTEEEAFRAQIAALGEDTTLLVDTYDIEEAVRTGVRAHRAAGSARSASTPATCVAHGRRGARRCSTTSAPRRPGSSSPATSTSGRSPRCRGAPVDGYGVGTSLVTGSGAPDLRLRLQAGRPRRQRRPGRAAACRWPRSRPSKATVGGRKYALRRRDAQGIAEAEVIGIGAAPEGDGNDRPLLRRPGRDGEVVGREPLRRRPRAARRRRRPSCPATRSRCRRGEPVHPHRTSSTRTDTSPPTRTTGADMTQILTSATRPASAR